MCSGQTLPLSVGGGDCKCIFFAFGFISRRRPFFHLLHFFLHFFFASVLPSVCFYDGNPWTSLCHMHRRGGGGANAFICFFFFCIAIFLQINLHPPPPPASLCFIAGIWLRGTLALGISREVKISPGKMTLTKLPPGKIPPPPPPFSLSLSKGGCVSLRCGCAAPHTNNTWLWGTGVHHPPNPPRH